MPKRARELEGLLGPLETDVMETAWRLGDATVRDVHAELTETREIAYTTVMTTMSRLASKGLLERDTSGLAHRYRPALSREEYARSTVSSVIDWLVERFPAPAMQYFVDVIDDGSDPDTMRALRERIDREREVES
jgi:predicted transcriptional regulator